MKKILCFNKILILLTLVLVSSMAYAQKPENGRRCINMKKFEKARKTFFNKKLNLTTKQEAEFWPVFDELQQKVSILNDDFHDKYVTPYRENKISANFDYEKAADAIIDVKLQESIIRKEYHQKFKKILTDKELYIFYLTEKEWFEHILHEIQRKNFGNIPLK